ncbi:hypothetical protein ARMGADRAFT_46077 [Armillaria gallica]|uniref:Uncharacterized protein n=1 Tax=Armillaria gallica TaxID=47427 RepID=A0A2H3EM07_ARMGA|nr:hypothetical protein ARMGADRAFT_46077 [Armillaria gallica]
MTVTHTFSMDIEPRGHAKEEVGTRKRSACGSQRLDLPLCCRMSRRLGTAPVCSALPEYIVLPCPWIKGLAAFPSYSFTSSQISFKSHVFSPFTFDSGEKIATNGKEMCCEGAGTGKDENCIPFDSSCHRRPQNDMLTEKVQPLRYRRVDVLVT